MATQDLTTYTEVDASAHLTVNASKADASGVLRSENVLLYKDFTADYFDRLNIDFEIYIGSGSTDGCIAGIGLSNTSGVGYNSFGANDIGCYIHKSAGSPYYRLYIFRGDLSSPGESDVIGIDADTLYYCTLERGIGNTIAFLRIYSDSGRTVSVGNPYLVGLSTTKYRYFYAFANYNDALGSSFTGYTQNIELFPTVDFKIAVSVGAFILTGIDVLMTYAQHFYSMAVTVGAFTLTGIDILVGRGISMLATVGQFILTGIDVLFKLTGTHWVNQSKNADVSPSNSTKSSTTWVNKTKS